MSALSGDTPDLRPTHKYELGQRMELTKGGKPTGVKFRWTCACGAKGDWVSTAGATHSGWIIHLDESTAATRQAIYDESPDQCPDEYGTQLGPENFQ